MEEAQNQTEEVNALSERLHISKTKLLRLTAFHFPPEIQTNSRPKTHHGIRKIKEGSVGIGEIISVAVDDDI